MHPVTPMSIHTLCRPTTMDEVVQRAIEWIRENPAYVLGYLESLEDGLTDMRERAGVRPVERFIDRFKGRRTSAR
jgi:hypothetical protein